MNSQTSLAINGEPLLPERIETTMPMRLIELAVEKGADADQLAKLMELQLKWEANEARKAYIRAMQTFKAHAPEILKTRQVTYGAGTGKVDYSHAELDKITQQIGEGLRAVGITHCWRTSEANGKPTVTCILTHELGHSEEAATLSGPADKSGGKNDIQAIGSTITYLERYTLLAATGLAAKNTDDDGRTQGMDENGVQDYIIQLQDANSVEELQKVWREAVQKAKDLGDTLAVQRFVKVKDDRKRELRLEAQV